MGTLYPTWGKLIENQFPPTEPLFAPNNHCRFFFLHTRFFFLHIYPPQFNFSLKIILNALFNWFKAKKSLDFAAKVFSIRFLSRAATIRRTLGHSQYNLWRTSTSYRQPHFRGCENFLEPVIVPKISKYREKFTRLRTCFAVIISSENLCGFHSMWESI